MNAKKSEITFVGPVISPKIKRLEKILEKRRKEKPLEQKIREKEEYLETMVYGFDFKRTKKIGK